jgi:DNA polymerase III delta subunit
LAKYLQSPSITTTLVLLNEDRRPDKKDALAAAAAAAGAVCIFSPLNEQEANERIVALARAAGKTLAEDAAEILVNEAGTDWGILSSETEKLIIHAGNAPVIDAQSVLMCLGYRKSADPWAFDRLIQSRELKPCLTHLYELFNDGKIEDVVFRNLALIRSAYLKQLKAKRLLKAGQSQREIETKLRIFYDNGFWARASRVSEDRLRKDLRRCIEVEASLKSKAWLDPRIEFEQLVIELCTPTRTGVDLTVC